MGWQAWQYDQSKARAQAEFTWLDEPGVWQEIDAYMVSKYVLLTSLQGPSLAGVINACLD